MDAENIRKYCNQILAAANNIEVRGESNAMQIVGICHVAKMLLAEVENSERKEGQE